MRDRPRPDNGRVNAPARLFLLVTVLSVPFWVLGWTVGGMLPAGLPLSSLMVVCPLIATLILVRRTGIREPLGRLIERPNPWWLLVSVATMPAIYLAANGFRWPSAAPLAVAAYVVVFLIAAGCEETAWSGYATDPLLARFGEVRASLILGGFWAAWHVIPWHLVHSWTWTAWQALFTVAARVLIVRIYLGAGRNVPVTVVFHAMINVCYAMLGPAYQPMPVALLTTAAAVGVLAVPRQARR